MDLSLLTHQRGGLEGAPGGLVARVLGCQLAESFVRQGGQCLGGLRFALLHAVENAREVADERSAGKTSEKSIPETKLDPVPVLRSSPHSRWSQSGPVNPPLPPSPLRHIRRSDSEELSLALARRLHSRSLAIPSEAGPLGPIAA